MPVAKVLLFYVFTPLADPEAIRLWQRDLCESLGLRGRILVSRHGINGTVGGELSACKRYARKLREYAPFKGVDLKWSDGSGLDEEGRSLDFPKLSVKARDEIVAFGIADELEVDAGGVVGGGVHLSPEGLHELVAERGDEVVLFDGRNAIEAEIGRFEGAVVPPTDTTHDFIGAIESGAYDELKGRPVVTYCTGGIRCEVLSAAMRKRGFGEVYQLEGGIVRYAERFGDRGLWRGSLAVFDGREHLDYGEDVSPIGRCRECDAPTSRIQNCADPACRTRFVACGACGEARPLLCPAHAA